MGTRRHLGRGNRRLPGRKGRTTSGRKTPFADSKSNRAADISAYAGNHTRKGNDTNGSRINSRKTSEFECATFTGEDGEDWKSLSSNERYLSITEGSMKHVLVSPFELFEILMEVDHEQKQGRLKIRIGTKGETESNATLNIVTKATDGIVGRKPKEKVPQSMQSSGSVLIPKSKLWIPKGVSFRAQKD